jgi:hypothetical protein
VEPQDRVNVQRMVGGHIKSELVTLSLEPGGGGGDTVGNIL